MAFDFAYRLSGAAPTILDIVVLDTEVLSRGELVNIETGEAATAAAGDTSLAGIAVEDVDNTADGESCRVIIDPDAVYSVVDNNARVIGALLDIASGALGVTTASQNDLVVVKDSAADERTLVTFNNNHFLNA